MVAVPGAMLLVLGGLDLSVGSVAGLSAASFGEFNQIFHLPLGWSIILALAVGGTWGLCNGILIADSRCSPVIVTLGGYAGAAGVAQFITSDNTRYGFGNAFAVLGNGEVAGLPVPVVIFICVFIVGLFVWYRTPVGRHLDQHRVEPGGGKGGRSRRKPASFHRLRAAGYGRCRGGRSASPPSL